MPIQKNCLETHYRSTLLTFFFAGTAFKVPLLTTPDFEERESVIFCQSLFKRILVVRREREMEISDTTKENSNRERPPGGEAERFVCVSSEQSVTAPL